MPVCGDDKGLPATGACTPAVRLPVRLQRRLDARHQARAASSPSSSSSSSSSCPSSSSVAESAGDIASRLAKAEQRRKALLERKSARAVETRPGNTHSPGSKKPSPPTEDSSEDSDDRYFGVVHVGAKLMTSAISSDDYFAKNEMKDFVAEQVKEERRRAFVQKEVEASAQRSMIVAADGDGGFATVGEQFPSIPVGSRVDKCVGSILGTACGDVLGANLEFRTAEQIRERWGFVRDFHHTDRRPFGVFTDDTEMTAALVESIVACGGRVDATHAGKLYAHYACSPPLRGYGPGVERTLDMIYRGVADPLKSGTLVFADGSWANGALMRIAPVGLLHINSDDSILREDVVASLVSTHIHEEAIDAAFLCAHAARVLARIVPIAPHGRIVAATEHSGTGQKPSVIEGQDDGNDAEEDDDDDLSDAAWSAQETASASASVILPLLKELSALANNERVKRKLAVVEQAHAETWLNERVLDTLIEDRQYGPRFAIRSSDAFGVVLWALLQYGARPEVCLIQVVNWGGDADTIGAITGSLLGAWHGCSWMPRRWWANIEDTDAAPLGLRRLVELGKALATFSDP